jgi:hypothetical protein
MVVVTTRAVAQMGMKVTARRVNHARQFPYAEEKKRTPLIFINSE